MLGESRVDIVLEQRQNIVSLLFVFEEQTPSSACELCETLASAVEHNVGHMEMIKALGEVLTNHE